MKFAAFDFELRIGIGVLEPTDKFMFLFPRPADIGAIGW